MTEVVTFIGTTYKHLLEQNSGTSPQADLHLLEKGNQPIARNFPLQQFHVSCILSRRVLLLPGSREERALQSALEVCRSAKYHLSLYRSVLGKP